MGLKTDAWCDNIIKTTELLEKEIVLCSKQATICQKLNR